MAKKEAWHVLQEGLLDSFLCSIKLMCRRIARSRSGSGSAFAEKFMPRHGLCSCPRMHDTPFRMRKRKFGRFGKSSRFTYTSHCRQGSHFLESLDNAVGVLQHVVWSWTVKCNLVVPSSTSHWHIHTHAGRETPSCPRPQ